MTVGLAYDVITPHARSGSKTTGSSGDAKLIVIISKWVTGLLNLNSPSQFTLGSTSIQPGAGL